eukprot:15266859-Ditylum_brightwellii.AAC.1
MLKAIVHVLFDIKVDMDGVDSKLIRCQQKLGFSSMVDGNICNSWLEIQDEYIWENKDHLLAVDRQFIFQSEEELSSPLDVVVGRRTNIKTFIPHKL